MKSTEPKTESAIGSRETLHITSFPILPIVHFQHRMERRVGLQEPSL